MTDSLIFTQEGPTEDKHEQLFITLFTITHTTFQNSLSRPGVIVAHFDYRFIVAHLSTVWILAVSDTIVFVLNAELSAVKNHVLENMSYLKITFKKKTVFLNAVKSNKIILNLKLLDDQHVLVQMYIYMLIYKYKYIVKVCLLIEGLFLKISSIKTTNTYSRNGDFSMTKFSRRSTQNSF